MSAGQGRGLLLRLESVFNKLILRRELTGLDEFGNKYYRRHDQNLDGYPTERRFVRTPKGDYDPNSVPPEWKSWLNKVRDSAPTPEEVARQKAARLLLRQRAQALDAEDAKRRFQAATMGQAREQADQQPNMGRFLDQLSPQGKDSDERAGASTPARSEQDAGRHNQPSSAHKATAPQSDARPQASQTFNPDVWKPGAV